MTKKKATTEKQTGTDIERAVTPNEGQEDLRERAERGGDVERTSPTQGYAIRFPKVKPQDVPLSSIFNGPNSDPFLSTINDTQTRTSGIDSEYVEELTEVLQDDIKAEFPPIELVYDEKTGKLYVCDGFHRLKAYTKAERNHVPARIVLGDKLDAIKAAAGANAAHGKRRTNRDKRKAVSLCLSNTDMQDKSDTYIAALCNVSQPFVSAMRVEVLGAEKAKAPRTTAGGGTYTPPVEAAKKAGKENATSETAPELEPAPVKLIGTDLHGEKIPDNLKELFTAAKEIKFLLSAMKKETVNISARLADMDRGDEPAIFEPMESDLLHLTKTIRTAILKYLRESLPAHLSPYDRGQIPYPASDDELCPVSGYVDSEDSMYNLGYVTETQYKEVPDSLLKTDKTAWEIGLLPVTEETGEGDNLTNGAVLQPDTDEEAETGDELESELIGEIEDGAPEEEPEGVESETLNPFV